MIGIDNLRRRNCGKLTRLIFFRLYGLDTRRSNRRPYRAIVERRAQLGQRQGDHRRGRFAEYSLRRSFIRGRRSIAHQRDANIGGAARAGYRHILMPCGGCANPGGDISKRQGSFCRCWSRDRLPLDRKLRLPRQTGIVSHQIGNESGRFVKILDLVIFKGRGSVVQASRV
ncbi:hypothetical protein D3C87_1527010 [compost metagenome]